MGEYSELFLPVSGFGIRLSTASCSTRCYSTSSLPSRRTP